MLLYRPRSPGRWFWRFGFSSAVVAWMLMIFYLSSLSQKEIGPGGTFHLEPFASIGRALPSLQVHLILYTVLAWLMQATLHSFNNSTSRIWPWALVSVTFAIVYAITDEFHQSFVGGRSPSVMDVVWDGLGAVSAAATLGYIISTWPWLRGQQAKWSLRRRISSAPDP